jgi:hypothetical protein
LVVILSLAWVVRLHEYGIESLHVRVVPDPVPATVFDSVKKLGLVVPSVTETSSEQVKLVRPAVLRVIVSVSVTVPVNVVAAGRSESPSAAEGTGRNVPV